MDFGKLLRAWREAARLSQLQLAGRSGLSKNYVGILERGISSPSIDVVWALAGALGTDLPGFFSGPFACRPAEEREEPGMVRERYSAGERFPLATRLAALLRQLPDHGRGLAEELGLCGSLLEDLDGGGRNVSTLDLQRLSGRLDAAQADLLGLRGSVSRSCRRRVEIFDLQWLLTSSARGFDDIAIPARCIERLDDKADLIAVAEGSTTWIVDRSTASAQPGMTAIALLADEVLVGRVTRSGESMLIVPRQGDPQMLPKDAQVLGQVVARFEDLVLEALLAGETRL